LPAGSRYPARTLHVGVAAGIEEARTYLKLDLSEVPSDASLIAATLAVPLAGSDAGTFNPASARVAACMVTAPFPVVEGSRSPPPTVDCSMATAAVVTPAELVVDLTSIATRWTSGEANHGVALLPGQGDTPGATWHLAFTAGTATATLQHEAAPPSAPSDEPSAVPASEAPIESPAVGVDPTLFGPTEVLVPRPPQSPAAAIIAETEVPEPFLAATRTGGPGFAYPIVMAVPLVLLALGGYLAWALSQPVTVRAL